VEYCDRSVSMHEAARRAVLKIQGDGAPATEPSEMRQSSAEVGAERDV
jgi:hypothetical protein